MKIRGLMIVLLLGLGIVYFIYFAKTGGKSNLQTEIDALAEAKVDLTRVSLETLEKLIEGLLAQEDRLPADYREIRRFQPAASFRDAWGREIRYERTSESTFRLTSAGPDGAFDTADDLVREYR
ncbi:MAG: hypothetical protein ACYDH0_02780 [Candidatus Aminicenantales bacterium]